MDLAAPSGYSMLPHAAAPLMQHPLLSLASIMLTQQYRMHPDISAFPSRMFYGGRLQDAIAASDRDLPALKMAAAMEKVLS